MPLLDAALFSTPQPIYGITLGMKACYGHDAFFLEEVKEGVREFPHQHAPHIFMHFGEG
jgi:hypothetical protein